MFFQRDFTTNPQKSQCALTDNRASVPRDGKAFEVAPLMADNEIDGLLWISSPGYDGFRALGEILNGEVNPSGHLVDTWYSDFTKDPTWFNFGDNSQTSADGKTPNYQFRDAETGEPLEGVQFKEFVQYEEGIYVDYRYYETVYADMVASDGKAAADAWYEENVVFPFGYGMSYTDFAVTEVTASLAAGSDLRDVSTGKITFEVTVQNTGEVAGKDVVQLYYHDPRERSAFCDAAGAHGGRGEPRKDGFAVSEDRQRI